MNSIFVPCVSHRSGATKKRNYSQHAKAARSLSIKSPNWPSLLFGLTIGIIITTLCFFKFSTTDITLSIPFKRTKATATKNTPPVKAQAQNQHTNIAEPKFEFYTELLNPSSQHSNTTSDLKSTASPTHLYHVQAGSFKKRSDANKLKAELTLNGFDAQIEINKYADNQLCHKIVIGPFKSEQQAVEQQKKLLALHNVYSVIVKAE